MTLSPFQERSDGAMEHAAGDDFKFDSASNSFLAESPTQRQVCPSQNTPPPSSRSHVLDEGANRRCPPRAHPQHHWLEAMEEYLSPALRQPPLPDSERKRLRELSRYYCTVREPSTFAQDSLSTPAEEKDSGIAHLSSDITLTALTQLGVYRFGCNRSFVSLIDGDNQHIISEATASISLRDRERHRELDGLYLGVTTLDLIFGVCPHAVKLFSGQDVPHLQNTDNVTANSTRYIVRDFTREEYFKERPYVTQWPHFRFYAEVPIYSPSGHILGSYCVVDNKPRSDFSEEDVVALQEISDSIARHLDNVRTVHYHRRSERLVQGLTTFAKQRPDAWDESLSPIPGGEALSSRNLMTRAGRERSEVTQPDLLRLGHLSLTTEESSPLFSREDPGDLTDATSLSVGVQDPAVPDPITDTVVNSYSSENSLCDGSNRSSSPALPGKDTVPLSARISSLFAHASALLRDSMAVDGVLFVDACHCNSGIAPSKTDLTDWEPLPKNADPRPRSHSPCCLPGAQQEETLCDTFGLALEGSHAVQNAIPSSLLQHLIAALPQGGVLHLDEGFEGVDPDTLASTPLQSIEAPFGFSHTSRPCKRSNPRILAARLAQCFPQAKSLLFIPLWDWNKGQWLAGTFVWTKATDNERSLGLDELNYFRVFGDSIISEIARLSWSQKEKSKFDLISSISHELRSPLHGMLANTELLSTSILQPEQREIVKALETSGVTLLDTMNHLLDFAKINNLTAMNKGASSVTSLVSTFNLDTLVEDVVNSVFTGMRHAAAASTPSESSVAESPHSTYKPDLSVVIRIEDQHQHQWKVNSMSGAWRRIVMNILGNALKYTQQGFIEVSLSMAKSGADRPSDVAHFCVTDTGRGMSQEFLRNKLFSPFTQEDSLSEGAGLGLSIVKQLVSFLGGSIDVKSEWGVGTQVDIYIPIKLVPTKQVVGGGGEAQPAAKHKKFSLIGLGAYPELSEAPTGTLSPKAKRKICLQGFFTNVLAHQPSWSVAVVESIDDADGDIAVVEENVLKQISRDQSLQNLAESKFTHIICLCDGSPSLAQDKHVGRAPVVYLSQPFSPRKVLQILKSLPEPSTQPTELLKPFAAAVERSIPTKPQVKIPAVCEVRRLSDGDLMPSDTSQVLIVDDNEINIKILAKLMSRLGYQHEAAINGLVALNRYKESPSAFKVVLMDVSMPVMDGIDATRHIRAFERERSLPPVKIYAVTGIASASMQKDALLAGVDEYLVKPLSLRQLSTIIKPHL
ncbi:hypothetical protein BJY00DRAFT_287429 [Aspergillus carlsbadensis]|nr:hypothetical protein BJY00DRAFT_287429 [Aspergillus carlsbadensis]